jgi:hypothetical protein
MVDRMSGDSKPHDYRWLGHFQPTKLTVDPATKAVETAPEDGKRLWLVPARPYTLTVEQGSGPLLTPQPTGALPPSHPHRAIGPYVALRQKAVSGPASFAVLLYPAADKGDAPRLESLPSDRKEDSVGFRVRRGANDDLLVLAPSAGPRKFGSGDDALWTDAETAFVRRAGGLVTEAGLTAGRRLEVGGMTILEVGPEVVSAWVRYKGDTAQVGARGRGTVRVAKGPAVKVVLNGKALAAKPEGDLFRLEVGESGEVALSAVEFATDPDARCRGIGVPQGYGGSYKGPAQSALVCFKTSAPADMTVEWRGPKDTAWKRVYNPEPTAEHYYLLSDLEHETTYQVRLTCRGTDGRAGVLQVDYEYLDPEKSTPKK